MLSSKKRRFLQYRPLVEESEMTMDLREKDPTPEAGRQQADEGNNVAQVHFQSGEFHSQVWGAHATIFGGQCPILSYMRRAQRAAPSNKLGRLQGHLHPFDFLAAAIGVDFKDHALELEILSGHFEGVRALGQKTGLNDFPIHADN
jgi:hypothetical protein